MARRSVLPGRPYGELKILGPFEVPKLEGKRHIRLYIPRGYDAAVPSRALYMFDAQNIFGDEGSFAGGCHAHEAVDRVATRDRRSPVIVGVDHGHEKRIEELMPFGEKLDALLEWMARTVPGLLASHVRLEVGPVHAALAGSSMGGIAALFGHFRRPDAFGGAIAMSPSLFVGRGRVFSWLTEQHKPIVSRVYLDCGAREGRAGMARLVEDLAAALRPRGYDEMSLWCRIDPRGTHSEGHWRRRLPSALRFMYRT